MTRIPAEHAAGEVQVRTGARDFLQVGEGVVRLKVPPKLLPT
jgi:hypothetical protein